MDMDTESPLHPLDTVSVGQQLPYDILTEIFKHLPDVHSVESESEVISPKTGPYVLRPEKFPWNLTRVCRTWRLAASHDGRLWSRVHIEVGQRPPRQGKIKLLETYLSHGKNCGLYVSIHCTFLGALEDNAILTTLLQTCERWRFASIHVHSKSLYLFHSLTGRLNALETLHLYVAHQSKTPAQNTVYEIFRNAPLLRNVRFRHSDDRSVFPMPLNQLQVYQGPVSSIPITEGPDWLANLRWCALAANARVPHWVLAKATEKVTAPYLREFSIVERIQPYNTTDILDILTMPNLEVLRVKAAGRVRLCATIASMLDRSMCVLRELCLDIPDLTSRYMLEVLRATPHITRLRITGKKILPDFFVAWKFTPETAASGTTLIPCVEHVDLGRCTFTPTAELVLLDAIRSRFEVPEGKTEELHFGGSGGFGCSRFKSIQVPYRYHRTKRSQKKVLKEWKAQGLDIIFGPGSQNRL